ncbi:TonB-dependent receptor domain-containing protein [Novosphingobium sp. HII-3]|uniref:TonB-dependent receptor domain-containing protein n=1 Tax=Novosphingobium sp. HII-3 TaxID=2075565 RepID=UPI000CDB7221|nr:TonB-dependent receptor [Novosphingobium sp. HII-3]
MVSPLGVPVVNVPKAEIYGAEFQLAVNPVDALRIDANLSLLHARYTESFLGDPLLDPALTPQDIKGHRLNNAPDVSGYLGIEYEIGLGRAGTLTPRGEMTATSDYNLREVNYPWTIQDGYVNGNAYVTWRDNSETLFVRGWIKNIADKAILGGVLGFGGANGSFAPPRTYGIEIGANF